MKRKNNNIAIILLAAGCSSRLGRPKQLIAFHEENLLIRQCKVALEVSQSVYCVLGYQFQNMSNEIAHLPISIIENKCWQQGLSSSISAGINALNKQEDAVLLLLVDQWLLSSRDLLSLIECWENNQTKIISAVNNIRAVTFEDMSSEVLPPMGPPVVFPSTFFPQLKQLTKGNGARSIIHSNIDELITMPLTHAFIDIDTPDDLLKFNAHLKMRNNNNAIK